MRRISLILLLILFGFSSRAQAFWLEGQGGIRVLPSAACGQARSSSGGTSITATRPVNVQSGDLQILFASADATAVSDIAVPTGWTLYTGWTTGSGLVTPTATNFNIQVTTALKWAMFWHVNSGGTGDPNSAPTVTTVGPTSGVFFSTLNCAWDFANTTSPIEQAAAKLNTSSTTVSFPAAMTPAGPNEESIWIGAGLFGAQSCSGTPTTCTITYTDITTCGKSTIRGSGQFTPTGNPILEFSEANLGPCAATSIAPPTDTVGSTAAVNTGATIFLNPPPFAAPRHVATTVTSLLNTNNKGMWFWGPPQFNSSTSSAPLAQWDHVAINQPFLDGLAIAQNWNQLEPFQCNEYYFDDIDNRVLNARILGRFAEINSQAGGIEPCSTGGVPAGAVDCTDPIYAPSRSGSPYWLLNSSSTNYSTCNPTGNVPNFINSAWTPTSFGGPSGSLEYRIDPDDPGNLDAMTHFMTTLGNRYTHAAAPHITAVSIIGLNRDTPEMTMSLGNNITQVDCGGAGTAQSCSTISGLPDWQASHTYAANTTILPTATNNNNACSGNPCTFKNTSGTISGTSVSGTFWSSCTSTCSDTTGGGNITWTNEGPYMAPLVSEATQWTSLVGLCPTGTGNTPSTTCKVAGNNTCTGGTITTGLCCIGTAAGCSTSTTPTLCSHFLAGYIAMEAAIRTAFPDAALVNEGYFGMMPSGTVGTGVDPFQGRGPNSGVCNGAAPVHDVATYPGSFRAQNNAMSQGFLETNLPSQDQPFIQIGFQTGGGLCGNNLSACAGTGHNLCNTGAGGNPPTFSISANDCIPPSVYAMLSGVTNASPPTTSPQLSPCYWEAYGIDLDSAPDQPWLQLCHDNAWGRGN